MDKSHDTLVRDIYTLLETRKVEVGDALDLNTQALFYQDFDFEDAGGGFLHDLIAAIHKQILSPTPQRSNTLRMSNLGTPCITKLWYDINEPVERGSVRGADTMKFLYGDLLEALLIALTKAAGHKVEAEQREVRINGIVGHLDCVIDGLLVDVKSASDYSFKKFKQGGGLWKDDGFGYLSQLSSYLYGLQDSDILKYKDKAGFLVINKVTGEICMDVYDMSDLLAKKEEEIKYRIETVAQKEAPTFRMPLRPQSATSPNMQLGFTCGYCPHKGKCFPNMRSFKYSNGIVHLAHVEKVPNVEELGAKPVVVPGNDEYEDF